ncbi:hypothetical protein R4Z09_26680 [Niallia oryzisoli]|uniref:Uncharacterized protein n=1 Tax=Niallia oryzisoli TaxID=1737571 RepID=A0ABZ2CI57_9BACI
MMSFTHFDEIYEICCGMTAEETVLVKAKPKEKMLHFKEDVIPDFSLWREAELLDIHDRENELLYV